MRLLVFAHRGEAQTFLKAGKWDSIQAPYQGLYKSEHEYLLITGEGPQNATEKTAYALGSNQEIKEVINLGIAGALDKSLELDRIYQIRTCYAQQADSPLFKSYTTDEYKEYIDCITTHERIISETSADKLRPFAQVVDREAWAIASVASLLNKKLRYSIIYLISDLRPDGPYLS